MKYLIPILLIIMTSSCAKIQEEDIIGKYVIDYIETKENNFKISSLGQIGDNIEFKTDGYIYNFNTIIKSYNIIENKIDITVYSSSNTTYEKDRLLKVNNLKDKIKLSNKFETIELIKVL